MQAIGAAMLGELGRHAVRLFHAGIDLRVVLLGLFELILNCADGREIFVELALVGGSQIRSQFPGVVGYQVQNAFAEFGLARPSLRTQRDSVSEEALE